MEILWAGTNYSQNVISIMMNVVLWIMLQLSFRVSLTSCWLLQEDCACYKHCWDKYYHWWCSVRDRLWKSEGNKLWCIEQAGLSTSIMDIKSLCFAGARRIFQLLQIFCRNNKTPFMFCISTRIPSIFKKLPEYSSVYLSAVLEKGKILYYKGVLVLLINFGYPRICPRHQGCFVLAFCTYTYP